MASNKPWDEPETITHDMITEAHELWAHHAAQLGAPSSYPGGPLLVPGFTDPPNADGSDEAGIEGRVDRVCQDLLSGRIVPSDIDRLDEAVKRTRIAQHVHRAMRRGA